MKNDAEERKKEIILRKTLQLRRDEVLALVGDLNMEEAATVLASAMNELLLPMNRTACFKYHYLISCE